MALRVSAGFSWRVLSHCEAGDGLRAAGGAWERFMVVVGISHPRIPASCTCVDRIDKSCQGSSQDRVLSSYHFSLLSNRSVHTEDVNDDFPRFIIYKTPKRPSTASKPRAPGSP